MDNQQANISSKSIQKVLNMRLENNKDAIEAIRELSTFYPVNSAERRRNLKSDIERQALRFNEDLLKHMRAVNHTLDNVYNDVLCMHSTVNDMAGRLAATRAKTKSLIEETTTLQNKIETVGKKQEIATSIIDSFQLQPSEVAALRASNVSVEMLSAMNKAKEIHKKCMVLDQAGCNLLAQDIMDQMTQYEENAMERLFRWAQARCRTIDQPDPTALLPQVMEKLQSKPQLFNQIMEEYCANRRDLLVRQLISALTRGGRPIEHRVTEPKRYVGDMLAWLHQAVPAEKDSLAYMLKKCENSDVSEKSQQALSSITEGVCHPLKVRIEHILLVENNVRDPLLVQSLLGLLRYYHDIIKQAVGEGKLESTLSELMETAERTLMISLTGRVAVLLGSQVEKTGADLGLTPGISNVLSLLTQVFSSDISTPPPLVQKIAACMLDPLFINMTESAARLSALDAAIFLLNCYYSVEDALSLHPFLDDRLERLKAQSDAQMDTLISEQASCLVAHLGLGAIYTSLQGPLPKPLSRHCNFDPALISSFSGKLGKVMTNPDAYTLPQLTLLTNVTRRANISRKAAAVIRDIYVKLYELVRDPENQYANAEALLPFTPEAVEEALNR